MQIDWPSAAVLVSMFCTLTAGIIKWKPGLATGKVENGRIYGSAAEQKVLVTRMNTQERLHNEFRGEVKEQMNALRSDMKQGFMEVKQMIREK